VLRRGDWKTVEKKMFAGEMALRQEKIPRTRMGRFKEEA